MSSVNTFKVDKKFCHVVNGLESNAASGWLDPKNYSEAKVVLLSNLEILTG